MDKVEYKVAPPGRKEEPYDRDYRCDTYWKLGFYEDKTPGELKDYLAEHNYQWPKNADKGALMEAVGRCQRGLLSYERCRADELRAFCVARKVALPTKKTKVSDLREMLRTADDEATFPHFMELPAELRNRVYELHFRDYDEISTRHQQPPITKVPQIRAEALPLFYRCMTFTWDLSFNEDYCIYRHLFTGDSHTLTKMSAAKLAQIRNFKLHWTRNSRGAGGDTNRRVNFSEEVSQGNTTKKMAKLVGKRFTPLPQEVIDVMQMLLRDIGYWDITWKLQHHHLIAFRDAVNEVLLGADLFRR